MKAFTDLFPVLLFFVAYFVAKKIVGESEAMYWATGIALAVSVAHIAWLLIRRQPISKMQWINVGIIGVMGSLTLIFHDKRFILVKPTVLYWFFALALLLAPVFSGKNLLKSFMEAQMKLPEPIWKRLNLAWALFFVMLGCINLLVAFNFSETIWVNFKLFGATAIMAVFAIAQGLWLSKHIIDEESQT